MPVTLSRAPSLVCAPGAAAGVLHGAPRPITALVDAALVGRTSAITASASSLITVSGAPSIQRVAELARQLEVERPGTVLALGGGSTLDLAKLASLSTGAPTSVDALQAQLMSGSRVGLLRLSSSLQRPCELIAVPTTLGTGSESTAVACVDVPQPDGVPGRVLVGGEQLRVDRIALDAELTASLPIRLVSEGALEVLARLYGALVGAEPDAGQCDLEAIGMARQAVSLLDRVAALSEPSGCDLALREELALLSSSSHRFLALAGRGPYPSPLWFLGNEVSMVFGVSKMIATAALMAGWLDKVELGDPRWGRRQTHLAVWPQLTRGRSVRSALTGWGFDLRLPGTQSQVELSADRLFRRWAGPLPMLGRFDADELLAVVADAVEVQP